MSSCSGAIYSSASYSLADLLEAWLPADPAFFASDVSFFLSPAGFFDDAALFTELFSFRAGVAERSPLATAGFTRVDLSLELLLSPPLAGAMVAGLLPDI